MCYRKQPMVVGEMVVVEMEHCLVILIAFDCLQLCVDV